MSVSKVQQIVRLVDAMALEPHVACSEGVPPPNINFSFLASRGGRVLARLGGVTFAGPGGECDPTRLFVRGRQVLLLEEDSAFLNHASRILGRRLR
jgi:hypothetical protein